MNKINFVKLFAQRLRENPSFFAQQKTLIDSQIQSSREIFRKRFGTGKKFKKNAREFLKNTGRIK